VEPTVSVDRAAKILGIGRASCYKAITAGELPSIRIGKRIVVPTAVLQRLLDPADTPAA
jgi:excisionase family DNA binding protein